MTVALRSQIPDQISRPDRISISISKYFTDTAVLHTKLPKHQHAATKKEKSDYAGIIMFWWCEEMINAMFRIKYNKINFQQGIQSLCNWMVVLPCASTIWSRSHRKRSTNPNLNLCRPFFPMTSEFGNSSARNIRSLFGLVQPWRRSFVVINGGPTPLRVPNSERSGERPGTGGVER